MRWDQEDLSSWTRTTVAGRVRLTGPAVPDRTSASTRLLLVLTPGGATEVHVVPFVRADQSEVDQRKNRTIVVGLERDAAPAEPVAIEVDLTDAVRGNWGDAVAARRRLDHLEITLPGADERLVSLREIVLDDELSTFDDAGAGSRQVEIDGLLRPSWFVHAGASVRFSIRVPRENPELRWHDGALPGTPARVVRAVEAGRPVDLWRSPPGAGAWTLQRIDLSRWSGQVVTLDLAVDAATEGGRGVGFYGDPRVLAGSGGVPAGIIVYLVDDLRADRAGARDEQGRALTPALDALAASGVRFARAVSTSAWTKPAIPTLLSGIPPTTHLVGATSYSDRLPGTVATLQSRFRAAGWRTASFSASPLGSTLSGLDLGFSLAAPPRRWSGEVGDLLHPGAGNLHEALVEWAREEPDLPFLAYVHTLEVHSHARSFGRADEPTEASYDRAVRHADALIGDLLLRLAEARRDRALLVVVVADHGESFGAHGTKGHGRGLYQDEIHIPMIFGGSAMPGVPRGAAGRVVEAPVSLADVTPTLVDLAGLPRLEEAWGRSLAPFLLGDAQAAGRAAGRPFVAASLLRYVHWPAAPKQHALLTPGLRKILRVEGEEDRIFDLGSDPGEAAPIASGDPRLVRLLDGWLEDQRRAAESFRRRHGGAVHRALDAGEAERLRSLGYLE